MKHSKTYEFNVGHKENDDIQNSWDAERIFKHSMDNEHIESFLTTDLGMLEHASFVLWLFRIIIVVFTVLSHSNLCVNVFLNKRCKRNLETKPRKSKPFYSKVYAL